MNSSDAQAEVAQSRPEALKDRDFIKVTVTLRRAQIVMTPIGRRDCEASEGVETSLLLDQAATLSSKREARHDRSG